MLIRLITTAATHAFPGGRVLRLFKDGINVTNSTNPLILTKNITLTVVDCCAPPPVRLAANCVAAGSLLVASIVSPNPITIGSAIHVIGDLYDNC